MGIIAVLVRDPLCWQASSDWARWLFVLIGAFEQFRWAVRQRESGRASSYHGPGLSSQAPKYSSLRHPASSVKGKLSVFPRLSFIPSWSELRVPVNVRGAKQNRMGNVFKCLVPMSCHAFTLQARLLSFITHLYVFTLGQVCTLYVRVEINVCLLVWIKLHPH